MAARKKFSGGDVVCIPIDEESLAYCKVLYISNYIKNGILLAVYGETTSIQQVKKNGFGDYLGRFWTFTTEIKNCKVVTNIPVTNEDKLLTRHKIGDVCCLGDDEVDAKPGEEYPDFAGMSYWLLIDEIKDLLDAQSGASRGKKQNQEPLSIGYNENEMGAWGIRTFDSDSSLDYFASLTYVDCPLDAIRNTIDELKGNDWLEIDESWEVLVCAEVICGVFGNSICELPDGGKEVVAKIDPKSASGLGRVCSSILKSIMNSSEILDEMRELGGDEYDEWRSYLKKLMENLQALPNLNGKK